MVYEKYLAVMKANYAAAMRERMVENIEMIDRLWPEPPKVQSPDAHFADGVPTDWMG